MLKGFLCPDVEPEASGSGGSLLKGGGLIYYHKVYSTYKKTRRLDFFDSH